LEITFAVWLATATVGVHLLLILCLYSGNMTSVLSAAFLPSGVLLTDAVNE
jgi:hypothetical protein